MKVDLTTEPNYFRSTISRGLETSDAIDRAGGMFGAGVIKGVSVITRGEALGHELWIDDQFVGDVAEAINLRTGDNPGVKARFTHPGMSSDGLGKHLGRLVNGRKEGDQAYADLHFTNASHNTPDGDLAEYVMDLAEESPDDFGLSIVFERDVESERQFRNDNTPDERQGFMSPDEKNSDNLRHARLGRLRAADAVDSPAANPEGLFSAVDVPRQAEAIVSYALGLSDDKPEECFGVDSDRVSGFVARFLDRHNLEVRKKDMADEPNEGGTETTPGITREQFTAELKRYTDAFGENGASWFADGITFEAAQGKQIELLQKKLTATEAELAGLQEKFNSLETGEKEPAEVDSGEKKDRSLSSKIRIAGKQYDNN